VTCDSGICRADWHVNELPAGHYTVRAMAQGAMSQTIDFTAGVALQLAAPTGVVAGPAPGGITVHWDAQAQAVPLAYSVWRQSTTDWQLLGLTKETDFLDSTELAGAAAAYRVDAVDSDGAEGVASQAVAVTTSRVAQEVANTGMVAPDGVGTRSAPGQVVVTGMPPPARTATRSSAASLSRGHSSMLE